MSWSDDCICGVLAIPFQRINLEFRDIAGMGAL